MQYNLRVCGLFCKWLKPWSHVQSTEGVLLIIIHRKFRIMFLQVTVNFITRIILVIKLTITSCLHKICRTISGSSTRITLCAHFLEIASLNLLSLVILLNLPNQQTHTCIKKNKLKRNWKNNKTTNYKIITCQFELLVQLHKSCL